MPWNKVEFDLEATRVELRAFELFLTTAGFFGERAAVAKLKELPNLCAMIGVLADSSLSPHEIFFEFDIQGRFAADLVVVNEARTQAVLVEFEGGGEFDIFRKRTRRELRDWSPRIEHAFGQVIDWQFAIQSQGHEPVFVERFAPANARKTFVIVCGRDDGVTSEVERQRFQHRRTAVSVAGAPVLAWTYDEFARELQARMAVFGALSAGRPA